MVKWMGRLLPRVAPAGSAAQRLERSLVWLRLAIVLAAVVPPLFFARVAWIGHEDAIKAAQSNLEEIARAAEEHAVRVMERNDVVMQQMLRLLSDDDEAKIRAREAELREVAMAILVRFPDIRSLSILSPDGRLMVSTLFFPVPRALEGADWDYFRWGDGGGATGSLTRGLLTDRTTGEPLFRVTKRRESAVREASSVIELAFSPSYFHEFYRRLTGGESRVSIALVNSEGLVVGNWPSSAPSETRLHEGSRLLQRMRAGEARGTLREGAFAPRDERFAAFRKVGDYPLFVATAQEAAVVFAGWKRQVLVLGAILFPVTLALVLASWLALRRTHREIEARRRLDKESEQRLLAEEALRHAQRLDALGQLAGGLAHDFNNLLTVVSNSAELLARAIPQAASRPELTSILRAASGGAKLTRRLLAFSRKQAIRPEVVRVQAALEDMLELLQATAGAGVIVDVQVDADTPAIEVDAGEMEIALINLVANARDAMHHAGRVEVRARRANPGEGPEGHPLGYALIAVSDAGEGMSEETLSKAFEPFFTTKPAGRGTGLGLSQVLGFCSQSGGTARITSSPRVGTTVSMLLPATVKAPAAEFSVRPTPSLRARVLLLERNRDLSSALVSMLEAYGCAVTAVGSPREAVRVILGAERPFDVVLSDTPAGARDAAALVKQLRRRTVDLPVVAVRAESGTLPPADDIIGALSEAISAHRPPASMH